MALEAGIFWPRLRHPTSTARRAANRAVCPHRAHDRLPRPRHGRAASRPGVEGGRVHGRLQKNAAAYDNGKPARSKRKNATRRQGNASIARSRSCSLVIACGHIRRLGAAAIGRRRDYALERWLAFRCLAQRARCAAPMRARASADIVRFFFREPGGRPRRLVPRPPGPLPVPDRMSPDAASAPSRLRSAFAVSRIWVRRCSTVFRCSSHS